MSPGILNDDQLIDLMVEEPRLIRRPILKIGDNLVSGFSARQWDELLS